MRHEERRLAEAAMGYIDDLRVQAQRSRELAELLNRYGTLKFGEEWDPPGYDVLDEALTEKLRDLMGRLS